MHSIRWWERQEAFRLARRSNCRCRKYLWVFPGDPELSPHCRETCRQHAYYAEQIFVDQLAAISWRQARLISLETALLDAQTDFHRKHLQDLSPIAAADPYFHLVKAWQALARAPQKPSEDHAIDPSLPPDSYDINSLELLRRYQNSLDRQFRNTLLNLEKYRQLQANRPAAPAPTRPSEQPVQPIENTEPPLQPATEPNEPKNPTTPHLLTLVKPPKTNPEITPEDPRAQH